MNEEVNDEGLTVEQLTLLGFLFGLAAIVCLVLLIVKVSAHHPVQPLDLVWATAGAACAAFCTGCMVTVAVKNAEKRISARLAAGGEDQASIASGSTS